MHRRAVSLRVYCWCLLQQGVTLPVDYTRAVVRSVVLYIIGGSAFSTPYNGVGTASVVIIGLHVWFT